MSPGAPGCVERQLTLTGTPEQISAANYLIQQRVAAEQVPRVRRIVLFRNRGTGSLRQSGITWMHSRQSDIGLSPWPGPRAQARVGGEASTAAVRGRTVSGIRFRFRSRCITVQPR